MKKIIFIFILVSLFIWPGCASLLNNTSKWNNLTDKKFYFTGFKYLYPAKDNKSAYEDMKNFPVKKLMYIISKGYNVEIDMSDYYRFVKEGSSSELEAKGFFRNNNFSWNSKSNNNGNKISIIFEKDYLDETKMKFKLNIMSGEKTMKMIEIDFATNDYLFKQLDFYIPKTDENISEYVNNSYETKETIPGIFLGNISEQKQDVSDRETQLKALLEDYVKTLDNKQKNRFKHEIIDYIYKVCE